jgi:AAA ATPase domain/Adenylate and Guanylate cyclase catalytic domain
VVDAAGEIFGDAPNIAARVQALAEPGAVLITARVQRQVAGLFVVEERGVHTLKGVPEPTALFRLVRASGGGRRSGSRHLTPLVGRDDEMTVLMRRWERARQGDGQLVMIVGEPGLGKSRVVGSRILAVELGQRALDCERRSRRALGIVLLRHAILLAIDADHAQLAHAMNVRVPDLEDANDLLFTREMPTCPAIAAIQRAIRAAGRASGA